jgi:crossover junction endodeoxyribonuclease RuvC
MIVLGVDPGTVRTGWGVVRRQGARLIGVAAGVIRANEDDELPRRLRVIHDGLRAVIAEHAPSCMAVEDVFSKHARSALTLGHARGVVLLCAALAELELSSYAPAVVKRSVAGRGQAPKEQIGRVVCAMLGMRVLNAPDATDALAVAITHANALQARRRA